MLTLLFTAAHCMALTKGRLSLQRFLPITELTGCFTGFTLFVNSAIKDPSREVKCAMWL